MIKAILHINDIIDCPDSISTIHVSFLSCTPDVTSGVQMRSADASCWYSQRCIYQVCSYPTFFYVWDQAYAGLSSLGMPGVPWHTQILEDQLTLFQPGGTDYAHLITTGTPGFSNLPTALFSENSNYCRESLLEVIRQNIAG